MRLACLLALGVACSLVALVAVPAAAAAGDPCARGGHDTCGTTGVGFYRTYRYGTRWFGDFHRVVAGEPHLFCIDLRFRYASGTYRYRRLATARLRNREGAPVPAAAQAEMAYALWTFGRSAVPQRQAAVMLYVHSLMGDARPGEVDAASLGPRVAALYRRVAAASARYRGPYRIRATLPPTLTIASAATAQVRVVSAAGLALPHVRLALAARGAQLAAASVATDTRGVATVRLTPTAVSGVRLAVTTEELAAARPRVYAPTARGATTAQRLAAPASVRLVAHATARRVLAAPQLATRATTQEAAPGSKVADTVTVAGLGGLRVPVHVELWGPFASAASIACTGSPYWTGSFVAAGDGTYTTPSATLDRAGYYAFRETIPAGPRIPEYTTRCAEAPETIVSRATPAVTGTVGRDVVAPGAPTSDRVVVRGLGRTPARVAIEVYGPFPSLRAASCSHAPMARSRVTVAGDTTLRSPALHARRPGIYVYRARVLRAPLVAAASTGCTETAQTWVVAPRIVAGRGDVASPTAAPARGGSTPVRVRIVALGVDAPVVPVGIDVAHGVLGLPASIHRAGWWRDGAAPGDAAGTVLVAGHVDSATAGAGAFFALRRASRGLRVELDLAGGGTIAYRVVAVRGYPKSSLPPSLYTRRGPSRLVLVTCGGPFDAASGHYRDNLVVFARPL